MGIKITTHVMMAINWNNKLKNAQERVIADSTVASLDSRAEQLITIELFE